MESREEFGGDLPLLSMSAERGVRERPDGQGRAASEDLSRYRVVEPGDLVINKLSARDGAYGVSRLSGLVSPAYWVLRPVNGAVETRWLDYVLRSAPYAAELTRISKHMPPAQFDLPWDQFRSLPIPVPPEPAQRMIADYLDAETARIDALIAKKLRLKAVLQSREAALVSSLWQYAAGRWGVSRLGRRLTRMEQGWSPQCEDRPAQPGEFAVVKAGCVNGGRFKPAEHKTLPPGISPRLEYLLRPRDLLVSRASGSLDLIGSAAVVPHDVPSNLLLCDKVYRLVVDRETDEVFVALMLRAHQVRELIKLGVSGGEGMANNLPSGVIRGLPLPLAPLDAQRALVKEAEALANQTRSMLQLLEQSVDRLVEHRRALITTAVTGELEIPGAA